MPTALTLHVGLPRAGTGLLRPVLAAVRAEPDRHRGRSVLSSEQLATADVSHARRLLDRLGAQPSTTTVVLTACDLGRMIPAAWQADVESGSTQVFERFVEAVVANPGRPAGTPSWTSFDLPVVAARWARAVGPERVVVATVPPPGTDPALLVTRFAVAAGLPTEVAAEVVRRRAPGPDQYPPGPADPLDLDASQVRLLRAVNEILQVEAYPAHVQKVLRGRLLAVWRRLDLPAGARPAVPEEFRPAVVARSDADVARLAALGVPVVGPLTDLRPSFGPPAPAEDQPVQDALVRDVVNLLVHDRFGSPPPGRLARAARTWADRWRRSAGPAPESSRLTPRAMGTRVIDTVGAVPAPRGRG